jgi:hypothetical protein
MRYKIPSSTAQETGTLKTYAYVGATPNPIGVGQEVLIHVGITQPQANVALGWEGLTVTIDRPDGKTETLGPFKTDATGGTGTIYVPSMTGNYTLQTHFPEQVVKQNIGGFFSAPVPAGTVMEASDSDKLTLIVQEEPRKYYPGNSLPTEYWTRPIDAQLREWNSIAGNWVIGLSGPMGASGLIATYNDNAPETAHILWAKPMQMGGLAGGLDFGPQAYECGDAYEGLYQNALVIGGILYYNTRKSAFPTQTVEAIDLHTGEILWNKPLTTPDGDVLRLSFGQVFYWDSYNYHAVFSYLWTQSGGGYGGGATNWYAFDPFDGTWVYTITNVPSGTNIIGEKGEIYRYNVDTRNGYMTLWNSSAFGSLQGSWGSQVTGRTLNASDGSSRAERAWTNITIPSGLQGNVRQVVLGDRVVGTSITSTTVSSWAFSLKPGQEGQLLFKNTHNTPTEWAKGNLTISTGAISLEDGVFTAIIPELRQHYGFSIETGEKIWGPTEPQYYLDFLVMNAFCYEGKLISSCMSGIIYAYDIKTGELLWKYPSADVYTEILWSDNWPMRPEIATGGKLYLTHSEHSPIDPKPRGAPFVCLNVTTGEEIFRINGAFRGTEWGGYAIIGDSIIATMDTYDQRVYAVGKGPSATTVTASPKVSVEGTSVLVEGMVTDISPGTEEYARTARFPSGVPAVSDANISDWMLYVYKQFERPADITGVKVIVEVVDPNNNVYEVGRTTSDDSGYFKLSFTPEVPGEYTIMASFSGSEAYYGSFARTGVNVEETPASTPEPTPMPASTADLYLVPGIVGIIVAIAVVGAILMLMLRKR